MYTHISLLLHRYLNVKHDLHQKYQNIAKVQYSAMPLKHPKSSPNNTYELEYSVPSSGQMDSTMMKYLPRHGSIQQTNIHVLPVLASNVKWWLTVTSSIIHAHWPVTPVNQWILMGTFGQLQVYALSTNTYLIHNLLLPQIINKDQNDFIHFKELSLRKHGGSSSLLFYQILTLTQQLQLVNNGQSIGTYASYCVGQ